MRGGSYDLAPLSASEPQQQQLQQGAVRLERALPRPLPGEKLPPRSDSNASDVSSSKHTLPMPASSAPPALPQQQPPAVQAASPQQQVPAPTAAFPVRQGQPPCEFYLKTGHCKFGENCRFDHPPRYAVRLNSVGLPLRPGEPACAHFEKTRLCKFGPACKFDHPELE